MPQNTTSSIPPQTTDSKELEEARERLMQDRDQTDDELTKQHEIGDERRQKEALISPTPPVRTD